MFNVRENRPVDEAAKLSAAYLNGVAVALLAVGSLGPLFSALYAGTRQPLWVVSTISAVCMAISFGLHPLARNLVKGREQ